MSGYRCVNYYELCRLCTASHGTKVHIFSEEGRRKDLIGKIAVCLPVVIDENDKLPKILCSQCLNQVESIAKFRETCINAQTMLESCLNSSKLRNGGKVYIKDVTPKRLTTVTSSSTLTTTTTASANVISSTTFSTPAPPLVKATYQTKTPSVTSSSDFLSSIIQAVGIQNMEDPPDPVATQTVVAQSQPPPLQVTSQAPQYTITLDRQTMKSNQIHYKIESTKPTVIKQEPAHSISYQSSSVDEFLKLKTNPQISATIVKNEPQPSKIEQSPQAKKQKISLVITTPPQQKKQKQQASNKPNTATLATRATVQKQAVALQDIKLISQNKCFLPITLKDGKNDQQIVAQIDTKNLVLPTAYLQMKIQPQITTVDGQHVVQLTNIPNSLSIATTQATQLRQQQQQVQATAQILSAIPGTAETATSIIPSTGSETKTLFTTSSGQNVTITHQSLATLTALQPLTQVSQQQPTTLQSTLTSTPQTSTIDTPAGKIQLTMLQNVPTSNIAHALPQKSGITIQRIKTEPTTSKVQQPFTSSKQASKAALNTITTSNSSITGRSGNNATTINSKLINNTTTVAVAQPTLISSPSTTTSTSTSTTTIATTARSTNSTSPLKTEVPPTCEVCEKVFKRKEHLAQHVKLHLGLRPFKCEEPNCNKAFSRKEHLMRHVVSHTGKKMFSCEFCQKLFSRKDNLNKHRRTHTEIAQPTGPFICTVCNRNFVVKLYYEQHLALHKSNSESNAVVKTEPVDFISNSFNSGNLKSNPMTQTSSVQSNTLLKQKSVKANRRSGRHDATVMNLQTNINNLTFTFNPM